MPRLKENAPSGATLQDLERHKATLLREIEKNRGDDKKEVDDLKRQLAEANEFIKARKKADEAREQGDATTTIVVPPNTMAPSNAQENKPTGDNNGPTPEPTSRKGWKNLW
jgi:hypothetical protein